MPPHRRKTAGIASWPEDERPRERLLSRGAHALTDAELNEGWDVKRVFQIVPHEERAFNSKLLIAQVLGRGLRVPHGWTGEQPEVTVFNHDAWAPRIRHLVNEILEDVSIEFERAATGERYKWQTKIQHKTYSAREVAEEMYRRLEEAQDPDDPDPRMRTVYTDKYSVEWLEEIVKASLKRLRAKEATESMKQKFLQALGTLRRKGAENVRYTPHVDRYVEISTRLRQADSVSAAELRNTKTIFYTDQVRDSLIDEQVEFFDEAAEPGSGFKCVQIANRRDFKSPLNLAIADSENERRFIAMLLQPNNLTHYDAWIKSTATRFYEIDYAWKKGEHPKRGKFSPDFFIKVGNWIVVVEIKGDEEIREPSEENRKKNEYAVAHFERINKNLKKEGNPLQYKFSFLTERSFNKFFQSLREGRISDFRSELDVILAEVE